MVAKSWTRNILVAVWALAGVLLSGGPVYAGPPCTNVPSELAAVLSNAGVVTARDRAEVPCHALSDHALHGVNGQGFTLEVPPPQFQQAVILWDEGGSQGGKSARASAQNEGLGNQQSNSVTLTSTATR